LRRNPFVGIADGIDYVILIPCLVANLFKRQAGYFLFIKKKSNQRKFRKGTKQGLLSSFPDRSASVA
jgi:hypothetical protein